jgi:hypothetical protein
MRIRSKIPLLGLACAAVTANAYADVSFHGYGQVVMGTTFSNNRTFPSESSGYSYHADPTFTPNSNFALQASAPLSSNITATTQILARGDNDFQPKFQWAYLKYQFNDTFALKAGRLQLPFYQYSDYEFVGQAYPWVVPPESVYLLETSTYDGLNFSAEKNVGDWFFFMQAIYGGFDTIANNPVSTSTGTVNTQLFVHDQHLTGVSLDSSYNDWLSLRIAAFYENVSLQGDGQAANPLTIVDKAIDSLNSQGLADGAKALATSNDPQFYYVASAQITRNNWLLLAEFQGLKPIAGSSGAATTNITSEYISLGYHFGKLLPLATFGHRNQGINATKMKDSVPAGTNVTVPVSINGQTINATVPVDTIIDSIAGNPASRLKDYFYEFTLRYDLTATVALKLDYTFYQSHYRTSDYFSPITAQLAGVINPPDCNRLLAAVTFSF